MSEVPLEVPGRVAQWRAGRGRSKWRDDGEVCLAFAAKRRGPRRGRASEGAESASANSNACRGGLAFRAHRHLFHSPLGVRVIKQQRRSHCHSKNIYLPLTKKLIICPWVVSRVDPW